MSITKFTLSIKRTEDDLKFGTVTVFAELEELAEVVCLLPGEFRYEDDGVWVKECSILSPYKGKFVKLTDNWYYTVDGSTPEKNGRTSRKFDFKNGIRVSKPCVVKVRRHSDSWFKRTFLRFLEDRAEIEVLDVDFAQTPQTIIYGKSMIYGGEQ